MTLDQIVAGHLEGTLGGFSLAEAICDCLDQSTITQAQISRKLGVSDAYVSRLVTAYEGASPELRDAWAHGRIGLRRAVSIARLDPDAQRVVLERLPKSSRKMPTRSDIEAVLPHTVAGSETYKSLKWALGEGPCPVDVPAHTKNDT